MMDDTAKDIVLHRNGRPNLDRYHTVEWWAARTVVEDGEHGPRFRLLRLTEQPHSGNSALRPSDYPEIETPVSGPSVPGSE